MKQTERKEMLLSFIIKRIGNMNTIPILKSVFDKKYTEFCTDLEGACPELNLQISSALALDTDTRWARFHTEVNPDSKRDMKLCPGTVLPGVVITNAMWENELSPATRKAIQEHLTVLSICTLYEKANGDMPSGVMDDMLKGFLNDMKEKLASTDFKKLSEKFAAMFASEGAASALPNMSQRFLKGKIAKLAEELVHEFRAEDFGLSQEQLLACERDPTQAFSLLLNAYTSRPDILQTSMKKIASRMQQKIQRGELRPEELAAEAEELMKECTDNPAFKEMLESMRNAFGGGDMETARAQGREGSARLTLARNRLRARLEKKKAAEGKK